MNWCILDAIGAFWCIWVHLVYFGAFGAFWQSCTFLMRSSASAAFVYQNVVPLNPNASRVILKSSTMGRTIKRRRFGIGREKRESSWTQLQLHFSSF